jgi:hypothetical protein
LPAFTFHYVRRRLSFSKKKKEKHQGRAWCFSLVNLTTTQVGTFFEILEDIDSKLEALGVVEINAIMMYIAITMQVSNH